MTRRLTTFLVMALWLVAAVSVAQADTGNIIEPNTKPATEKDGWQAATCNADEPTKCSPNNPDYFVEAGGHPPIGFTQYTIQTEESTGKIEPAGITIPTTPIKGGLAGLPDRSIKTLRPPYVEAPTEQEMAAATALAANIARQPLISRNGRAEVISTLPRDAEIIGRTLARSPSRAKSPPAKSTTKRHEK